MSANEFFTKVVWENLWDTKSPYYLPNVITNGINQPGVTVDPMGDIEIDNVPPSGSLQLMKSHDLASWLPIPTGYIGIQFSDVAISQMGSVSNGGLTYTDNPTDPNKGSIVAVIDTPGITVSGNYVLVATGLSECALDTAGALSFLPGSFTAEADPSADVADDDNPVLDQYLQAARDQRTRLWQTSNGGTLMERFYDHNETYNWLFQNDVHVQTSWQMPANKQFLQDTHDAATNSTTPVNNGSYTDDESGTTTYNENAFNQQEVVVLAAYRYYKNPPSTGSVTAQQFLDAAQAADSFQNNEVASTNNTSTQTTVMTVDDVFNHVSAYQPTTQSQESSAFTLENYQQQLTPKQQEHLKIVEQRVQQRATLNDSNSGGSATMIQGSFTLSVSAGSLTMNADLDFPPIGSGNPTATVTGFKAGIQVDTINIDNISDWTVGNMQSIGSAVTQALEQASFVRSLMVSKLNDALGSDTVENYISGWLNDTLAKVLGPLTNEN